MSSKSASTLLNVVKSHKASDVMEFTAQKKGFDRDKAQNFKYKAEEGKDRRSPSSVIVVDSKMTPLEAATLLWENNV